MKRFPQRLQEYRSRRLTSLGLLKLESDEKKNHKEIPETSGTLGKRKIALSPSSSSSSFSPPRSSSNTLVCSDEVNSNFLGLCKISTTPTKHDVEKEVAVVHNIDLEVQKAIAFMRLPSCAPDEKALTQTSTKRCHGWVHSKIQ